jgi:Fe-S cluster assembly iron-binding protein IscA
MNITNKAKQMLENVFKDNGAEGIRFYFKGAGCCGSQIGLSLDASEESDVIKTINGIRVAIDERVVSMTEGLTLDHQEGPEGARFVLLGMESSCC